MIPKMRLPRDIFIRFTLFVTLSNAVLAFDSDEMEVFDAVEEIGQNFYTLLDIPQNADHAMIKKAFRRLSLVLHPDKNDAPDAEVKFRQLVAVYDIVKDPSKRRCYDNVLENGLPDWKQAVYYYRRVRKMGLTEMTLILFIIISIGQYLVGWAAYLERKYTVEEYLSSKSKRIQKKQKKGKVDVAVQIQQEIETELKKPSVVDTLPFQVPRLVWFLLVSAPPLTYQWLRDYWDERQRQKLLDAEEQEESEEEEVVVQPRGPRRRKPGFSPPEVKDDGTGDSAYHERAKRTNATAKQSNGPPIISGGLWTDDDLSELVKLVKKYPVGTSERWERIGETMRRPPSEVAHMAHKVKDNLVKSLTQRAALAEDDEENEDKEPAPVIVEEPKKVKTRGGKLGEIADASAAANWSQVQQKALETALAKFPKNATADRWEKIAKCVPGKTKEDCMIRYKQLVGLVKKKKETESCGEEGERQAICDQENAPQTNQTSAGELAS